MRLDAFTPRRVSVVLSGAESSRERLTQEFGPPLRVRVEGLGSTVTSVVYVALEEEGDVAAVAEAIRREAEGGSDLIVLAGETAILDRRDIAPRAVEEAGGEVVAFGAPVDPGHLLMLAFLGDAAVLGAPACARSPKPSVLDAVLPRLLVGERLTRADLVALGHGGLLEDIPERPHPRS